MSIPQRTPLPAWANEETIVDTYETDYMPDGTVSAHGFTTLERRAITIPRVARLGNVYTADGELSDLTVGVGTTITEGEEVFIPGVFVRLNEPERVSFYIDAESARKAAAALLEAADILEGVQR